MTLDIATVLLAALFVVVLILAIRRPPGADLNPLVETMKSLSGQVRELEAESAVNRGLIRSLEDRIPKLLRMLQKLAEGLNALTGQIVELGEIPIWKAPADVEEWLKPLETTKPIEPDTLIFQNLGEFFSEDELKDLAAELRIDYDSLPATGKRARARELTRLMMRRGRLAELVAYGKRERPNADWPDM